MFRMGHQGVRLHYTGDENEGGMVPCDPYFSFRIDL